jgi:DNA-binding MarR family transcriptional regulator
MGGRGLCIDGKPGHLIRRIQQISFALFMKETRDFRITPVQYSAVLAINAHPGIGRTVLCNSIAFDWSTIGDGVSRLERKKLIKRRLGSVDQRAKALYLTAAGRRVIRDIEPAVESTQRLILAPLKSSQRNAFLQC